MVIGAKDKRGHAYGAFGLVVVVLLLSACKSGGAPEASSPADPAATTISVPDPAMQTIQPSAAGSSASLVITPASGAVVVGASGISASDPMPVTSTDPAPKMAVDLARRLVYLPTTGWLSESQYWDIYFNQPEKLTVEIDEEALEGMGFTRPDLSSSGAGGGAG